MHLLELFVLGVLMDSIPHTTGPSGSQCGAAGDMGYETVTK